MPSTNGSIMKKPVSITNMALWLFLVLFAGKFVVKDALPYFGFDEEVFGRYWNVKWPLIGHISTGLIALVLGPLQFWKAFRTRYLLVHRWLGRTYIIAIAVGSICSTYLAWTSGIEIHWTWAFALQMLAVAWFCTAAMAYIAVRKRNIAQHKEWMIRSYVVTFAFVLFRWMNELPFMQSLGSFVERGPTEIWISWAVPLFFTELILQGRKVFR